LAKSEKAQTNLVHAARALGCKVGHFCSATATREEHRASVLADCKTMTDGYAKC